MKKVLFACAALVAACEPASAPAPDSTEPEVIERQVVYMAPPAPESPNSDIVVSFEDVYEDTPTPEE